MKEGWGDILYYTLSAILFFNENDEIIHHISLMDRVYDMIIYRPSDCTHFKVVMNYSNDYSSYITVHIANFNEMSNVVESNDFNPPQYDVIVNDTIPFNWEEGYYFKKDGTFIFSKNFYTSEIIPLPEEDYRDNYFCDLCGWKYLDMGGIMYVDSEGKCIKVLSFNQNVYGFRIPKIPNAIGIRFCRGSLFASTFKVYTGEISNGKYNFTSGKQTGLLNGLKYVALGDSVTIGGRYTSKVVSDTGLSLTNLGVGGMRITGDGTTGISGTDKLSSIPLDAKVITLNGGINDWYSEIPLGNINDTSTETFYGAMNTIIKYINENIPECCFLICSTTYGEMYNKHGGDWNDARTNRLGLTPNDYGDAMIEAAKKHNCHWVDTGRVGYNQTNIRSYMIDDGGLLHPNDFGGSRIGKVISSKLFDIFS